MSGAAVAPTAHAAEDASLSSKITESVQGAGGSSLDEVKEKVQGSGEKGEKKENTEGKEEAPSILDFFKNLFKNVKTFFEALFGFFKDNVNLGSSERNVPSKNEDDKKADDAENKDAENTTDAPALEAEDGAENGAENGGAEGDAEPVEGEQ